MQANLLKRVLRVAQACIVSFPNFAIGRIDAALGGRLPVSASWPYQWHNTPNVRVLTVRDFAAHAHAAGIEIIDRVALPQGRVVCWGQNWRGSLGV